MIDYKQEIFEFLDGLRESGITNMYGANSYIQSEFGIDKKDARKFLIEWMATFAERHPNG